MEETVSRDQRAEMGRSLLWTNLFSEPLFTLYNFLAFILYKDLGASAFQIALLTMLKPVITILSFYWSAGLKGRSHRLKSNVLWAGFLMRAPFLLCPWVESSWFVIGAAVNYMFFYRAGNPAWVEIMKRNMGEKKRAKAFSISSAVAYGEGVVISLAMGAMLDCDAGLWKGLFFVASLIGLLSLTVQARIPVEGNEQQPPELLTLKEVIVRPWRDSYKLIREGVDFRRFQWGFMVCGFGIMLIQPALPLFMIDQLGITYLEMAGAIAVAKGLGFVLSSFFWGRLMDRMTILRLSSLVFLSAGLFPILLSFSIWGGLSWLYLAYFCYGICQSGNHLVWNLSGPIFAGKEESSRYTGVNVVLAGLRGTIAPPMGSWLSVAFGPVQVLIVGGLLCFYSGARLLQNKSKNVTNPL